VELSRQDNSGLIKQQLKSWDDIAIEPEKSCRPINRDKTFRKAETVGKKTRKQSKQGQRPKGL
jgi:hypothetical protein